MGDPIRKITLKSGATRYRLVLDVGRDPRTNRRLQRTMTFDRRRDAAEELHRIRHELKRGDFVRPTRLTVDEALDQLLPPLCAAVEPATAANFVDAMKPVRAFLGHRELQQVDEDDIDALVHHMLTVGRVRGGKPGTGLSVRSVSLTLGRLRKVLNVALRRKMVTRNVAAFTEISRAARTSDEEAKAQRVPWSTDEVRAFLLGIRDDRLFAPLTLSLMGLRPAEVCGLRWVDVDLEAATLTVATTRTIVAGQVVEKAPKTKAGRRVLPLPVPVVAALKAFRKVQAAERLAAGPAYVDSGQVLIDELGEPWRTDQLRRAAYRLMKETGSRKVRLYDARHACLTFLMTGGVPDVVVSAWAGHADLNLAKRVYTHPNSDHLREASDALARLLG